MHTRSYTPSAGHPSAQVTRSPLAVPRQTNMRSSRLQLFGDASMEVERRVRCGDAGVDSCNAGIRLTALTLTYSSLYGTLSLFSSPASILPVPPQLTTTISNIAHHSSAQEALCSFHQQAQASSPGATTSFKRVIRRSSDYRSRRTPHYHRPFRSIHLFLH